MAQSIRKQQVFMFASLAALLITASSLAAEITEKSDKPMITSQLFEEAKKNQNWKTALATGKEAQIVLMSISPLTNPKNEIGVETHPFDQVIIIAQGNAKAVLDGKESIVKEGGMIFIPMGTEHNVINMDREKELKIVSIYSETDIPYGAAYKTKAEQPADD